MKETTKITLFKGKQIRRTLYKNEWWFVIVDVISVLTDSIQPDGYIKDMRRRDAELSKGWGKLPPPFLLLRQADRKCLIVLIRREYSVLSNQFPLQKPSHSNVGWQKLVMNVYRK